MIGETIWIFDQNRRVYPKGSISSAPIWREHWAPHRVVGETKRSWVLECGRRVPKAGGHGVAFSREEIDKAAYVNENARKIAETVRCLDYEKLKQIADLIGYAP